MMEYLLYPRAQNDLRAGSADVVWRSAVKTLLSHGRSVGSRDGGSRELIDFCFTLMGLERTFTLNPVRKLDPSYASAELLWYLSGQSNVEMIKAYAPQYSRFAEPDGNAHGAYGRRWRGSAGFLEEAIRVGLNKNVFASQLEAVAELLRRHPESRQAVISLWNDGDLPHAIVLDKRDLPCTLTMQFFIRQSRLHLTVNMRSNDVWLGLPYDMYAFTCVQRIVAHMLECRPGLYHHHVGSLHLYDRNLEAAERAANAEISCAQEACSHDWFQGEITGGVGPSIVEAIRLEKLVREGSHGGEARSLVQLAVDSRGGTVVGDALACCVQKWMPGCARPYSTQLQAGLQQLASAKHPLGNNSMPGDSDCK